LPVSYRGLTREVRNMVTITKQDAQARLGNVSEAKRFWVADGRYLSNLEELKTALDGMTDETYTVHSNENKSDFSKWADEVIGDAKLAADLKKSATRLAAAKYVTARIKYLKSKAGA
jgi:hypothetical protein